MRNCISILVSLVSSVCFSQTQSDYSIRNLKGGKFINDNTPVYLLPFERSKMSHKDERALDFKVKKGKRFVQQEMVW